ncbi:hypothetical protein KGF56_004552 [Candida oxycetoniae]|uniref:Uncharacterized protein n=1 Tax=Candida oxycetoniae TaxID=497107 RepID=A0AAI9STB6_9ASCO|nr:uncharacterized protein KGF56_004552 [Candida oxycetoniae]KAI3402671.2 hypothetical protein KGF56_004552 [Candida oxycetoniae]
MNRSQCTILLKSKRLLSLRSRNIERSLNTYTSRSTIHVAINLLFPGLGDPIYNDQYKRIDHLISLKLKSKPKTREYEQIALIKERKANVSSADAKEEVEVEAKVEAEGQFSKIVEKNSCVLDQLNAILSISNTDELIVKNVLFSSGMEYEKEDEFYNELLEFDKLNKRTRFNPIILCGNIEELQMQGTEHEFIKIKHNSKAVASLLKKLAYIGEAALNHYWGIHGLGTPKVLKYSSIFHASGLLLAFTPKVRMFVQKSIQNEAHYKNIILQYLGATVLINGKLSKHFVTSLANFAQGKSSSSKRTPKTIHEFKKLLKQTEVPIVDTSLLARFATLSIDKNIKRYNILHGLKSSISLSDVRDTITTLNTRDYMASYGKLLLQDYQNYGLPVLQVVHEDLEMEVSFADKICLTNTIKFADFDLPVVKNRSPEEYSPYKISLPLVNNNLINKILLLNKYYLHHQFSRRCKHKGRGVKAIIRSFELFGNLSFVYFMQMAKEEYLVNFKNCHMRVKHIKAIFWFFMSPAFKMFVVKSAGLLTHIVDTRSLFPKDTTKSTLQALQEISVAQFNQLFGCLSEEQKQMWCRHLFGRFVEVASQLDQHLIEDFFIELTEQLLERNKIFDYAIDKAPSLNIQRQLSQVNCEEISKERESQYYRLALSLLTYLNVEQQITLPIAKLLSNKNHLLSILLVKLGYQNIVKIGYLASKESCQELGRAILREVSNYQGDLEKSLITSYISATLEFRLGRLFTGNFWEYDFTGDASPPQVNFDSTIKRLLLVNNQIADKFFTRIGMTSILPVGEVLKNHGVFGHEIYTFHLNRILTNSRLTGSVRETVFELFYDRRFKRKINKVTGMNMPTIVHSKYKHVYQDLIRSERCRLIEGSIIDDINFNQFLTIQYYSDQEKLQHWLEVLVGQLVTKLEACVDDYDRDAVIYKFKQSIGAE